jgi:hypothetical protein
MEITKKSGKVFTDFENSDVVYMNIFTEIANSECLMDAFSGLELKKLILIDSNHEGSYELKDHKFLHEINKLNRLKLTDKHLSQIKESIDKDEPFELLMCKVIGTDFECFSINIHKPNDDRVTLVNTLDCSGCVGSKLMK